MAKIGLKNLRYGILTEDAYGTPTYGGSKTFGKAIECKVAIESNDVKLYADDAVAESDTSFKNGTVSLGVDEDNDNVFADILGHTITDGEIDRNANDIAPYVGLGRILPKVVNGVKKYKVEFLRKVKFHEPSQEEKTKGESIEFSTPTVEGAVATLADGRWSAAKTFTTGESMTDAQAFAAAVAYLRGLLGDYEITATLTNVTAAAGNVTMIAPGETVVLTYKAADGATLPTTVTVTGATGAWDKQTGKLTLSEATGAVSFSVTGTK